ncbi:hypothetical protein [Ferruginivarius sediminum]|uniref:Uncharacterized protein n=1 Tax=Ferruginivarius sediminum TaxID=2661937 RepID=A0A369TAH0_9PROT|nr:hypothetical protein [Ferruginivarius sediminum]RDD61494.1 hypothetical protein DRB17_12385 [Ferruginivarius sediminum]
MSEEQPRRLSDKIAAAHEQACNQGKADVARSLLHALELELSAHGGAPEKRTIDEAIESAFTRQRLLDTT